MKSRPKGNFAKITPMQKWKFEYIACVTPCYFLPFVVAGSLFSSWNYIVILKAAAEAACNPKIAAFVPEINLHEISCKTLNGAEQGPLSLRNLLCNYYSRHCTNCLQNYLASHVMMMIIDDKIISTYIQAFLAASRDDSLIGFSLPGLCPHLMIIDFCTAISM